MTPLEYVEQHPRKLNELIATVMAESDKLQLLALKAFTAPRVGADCLTTNFGYEFQNTLENEMREAAEYFYEDDYGYLAWREQERRADELEETAA